MIYGYDLSEFAGIDHLLDFHEVRVESQYMAHAHQHAIALCVFQNGEALFAGLCDRLFEQDVIPRIYGFHAGDEMLVLGRSYDYRIGRNRSFEKIFIRGEACVLRNIEFAGQIFSANIYRFHYTNEFEPVGMQYGIFQIFVRAVACTYYDDFYRSACHFSVEIF